MTKRIIYALAGLSLCSMVFYAATGFCWWLPIENSNTEVGRMLVLVFVHLIPLLAAMIVSM